MKVIIIIIINIYIALFFEKYPKISNNLYIVSMLKRGKPWYDLCLCVRYILYDISDMSVIYFESVCKFNVPFSWIRILDTHLLIWEEDILEHNAYGEKSNILTLQIRVAHYYAVVIDCTNVVKRKHFISFFWFSKKFSLSLLIKFL